MPELFKLILLFAAGLAAGFINVMAGGGSSITLPLLIFMGLDSSLANGTNRLAVFIQNITAVIAFRREKYSDFKTGLKLAAFTLPGAIIGAIVAVRIENDLFQKILGVVMIGIMITILLPKKSVAAGEKAHPNPWLVALAMLGTGFYGGFLQIGVGFIMMAILQNMLKLDLIRVNMHKVFIVFFFTLPALLIFIFTGNVNWFYGLALAGGNALGAWWGVKIAVKKGEKVIRIVLTIAIFIMAAKLLGVF
ncbi:MAG TPA: sulfite exporter TauE/SafE family protein [bacterium]|nr:sulfite exporter TauE/SafE family protein [bacterium]HPN45982.1 sulfite exporter TauE/SafE family protein [bacterium]